MFKEKPRIERLLGLPPGLDEGTIAEWYVSKGQQVSSGDPLVKMETDKVVTERDKPKMLSIIEAKLCKLVTLN